MNTYIDKEKRDRETNVLIYIIAFSVSMYICKRLK